MAHRILVVEDDPATRSILRDKLSLSGHDVETAGSAEEALSRVKAFDPALVITDIHLPEMNGLELLERVRSSMEGVDVLVITGHEDMSSAVTAMKSGAFDYIVKPVDLSELDVLVGRCLHERELNQRARTRPPEPVEQDSRETVVGRTPRMIEIYKMIGVLAANRATVLIRGETGTGKEMIARAIHLNSAHADAPFIAVNCSALTETLLESELFGHVRGAFTGAVASRKGFFELAGSGTIFLDEIGDTSQEFQTKLLRVLQEKRFYPVGGEITRTTEARVIAATHQPIERMVESGTFREDLYFRLRVVEIEVPPLRERRDDIPLLAEHLLVRIREDIGVDVRHISPEAMVLLKAHDWPGNVRELENALTRAAMLARGSAIGVEHLSLGIDEGLRVAPVRPAGNGMRSLDDVIAEHVERVLARTGGNKSEAARVLEISRSRLARLLKKFEIDVPSGQAS